MNKKIYMVAALILGGLVVGASVEHLRMAARVSEVKAVEPEVIHHVQKVAAAGADKAQEALITALKAKVEALNSELAALRKKPAALAEAAVTGEERPAEERRRESWTERNERMKSEEPEKYAEMQQRREEFKTKMEQRSHDRRSFLAEIDVANMSPEQQANHTRLIELTDKIDAAMKQMMSGEAENSHEVRREMFESFGELGELYTSERQYLLEETAAAVGYKGDAAALFTAHIQDIIENTTMQPPMMGGRGARGGPGAGRSN